MVLIPLPTWEARNSKSLQIKFYFYKKVQTTHSWLDKILRPSFLKRSSDQMFWNSPSHGDTFWTNAVNLFATSWGSDGKRFVHGLFVALFEISLVWDIYTNKLKTTFFAIIYFFKHNIINCFEPMINLFAAAEALMGWDFFIGRS